MSADWRLSIMVAFVLTGLSTIVVALRFYSRHFLVGKLNGSDWVMLLALIAAWVSVVLNWYTMHCPDQSNVHSQESIAPVATGSLLSFWIYRISYILNLCLIKTSILLFFNYIASSRKSFYYLVRGLLTIILLGSVAMIVASVFICYPVSDAWSVEVFELSFYGVDAPQCYNPGPFMLANAAYNFITDVLIWTLPIVFFLDLRTMSFRRRLELFGVFSVGIMAIVASAVRLYVVTLGFPNFIKQIENMGNLMIWSQVEQNTGVIAGSIPFLRPLFRKALLKARNREQPSPSPSPAAPFIGDGIPPAMPRSLIIPSPSPTFDESKDFRLPNCDLPPIEPVRYQSSWHTAIWDGSQVRQVLPT